MKKLAHSKSNQIFSVHLRGKTVNISYRVAPLGEFIMNSIFPSKLQFMWLFPDLRLSKILVNIKGFA